MPAASPQPAYPVVTPGAEFRFPRDHGAHPAYRTEWWYFTGWLEAPDGRPVGGSIAARSGNGRPAALANTAWPGPRRWLRWAPPPIAGELCAFPMRFVLASLAIAIGVALAFAVHVIKRSDAESFGQAVRSASGGADLQVRGVVRGVQADPRQPPGMFPAHSSVPGRCAPCCRR